MNVLRVLIICALGPVIALLIVWQEPLSVASISAGESAHSEIVGTLRTVADDSVLKELRDIAVSYPRFDQMQAEDVLEMADKVLAGEYVPSGLYESIGVPFQPGQYLFGQSGWHLELHSFAIPSLLGRAYEVSGEAKYIQAAAQYIADWSRFESTLLVPRGFFFNDHATASRSIVVTEVWRLYRNSDAYQENVASDLVHYVQKLSRLLLDERLYEYRSNHGIMQCMALLHLATAFPALGDSERKFNIGWERLKSQLEFYVNAEGVILEHSSTYHLNGLGRLASIWRYLGINGIAVSDEMMARYDKGLEFGAALRRPDNTVPPIGDTRDYSHSPGRIGDFDRDGIASQPLRNVTLTEFKPERLTLAAAAGYAILWSGLENWPASEGLVQTVFHWGNFPTKVHKHADEMSVSIWADGFQWVRGVGYWPYKASRRDAIGWRSSNGPHWLDESPDSDRSSSLEAFATSEEISFFDVIRENAGGRRIRRQVVKLGTRTWVIVDSFDSEDAAKSEIVWRFSPGLTLQESGAGFELSRAANRMTVLTAGDGNLSVDGDEKGEADWNSGLVSDGEIIASPAIRMQSGNDQSAVVTVLRLHKRGEYPEFGESVHFRWNNARAWTVDVKDGEQQTVTIERAEDSVDAKESATAHTELHLSNGLSKSATDAMNQALKAYRSAARHYGEPFTPMLERRAKITAAILAAAILQLAVFAVVARRFRRLWQPILIGSSLAWLGLSLFLGLYFLV